MRSLVKEKTKKGREKRKATSKQKKNLVDGKTVLLYTYIYTVYIR